MYCLLSLGYLLLIFTWSSNRILIFICQILWSIRLESYQIVNEMGKKNFKRIYQKIKADNYGRVSCKISYFSDRFDPTKNYGGVIIYGYDGSTQWRHHSGKAKDFNGKSFYIVIKDTEGMRPAPRDGLVHGETMQDILGIPTSEQQKYLRGGFAFLNGRLKFNSLWCNATRQKGLEGFEEESDGDKELSSEERVLVEYCWQKYLQYGPNAVFDIPSNVERAILG